MINFVNFIIPLFKNELRLKYNIVQKIYYCVSEDGVLGSFIAFFCLRKLELAIFKSYFESGLSQIAVKSYIKWEI